MEEADKGAATCKEPAMVEEAWAKNPPLAFRAKTVVEAKSWTSRAFLVWPWRVRRARLMESVEVAPMVKTALLEALLVPTTNWSVRAVAWTRVPVSVNPAAVAPASSPQRILPLESVSRAVQEVFKVEIVRPPVLIITPPEKVELAVEPIANVEEERSTPVTWRLPATVEEAEEVKPERVANPPTFKVEEADNGAPTCKAPDKVEEALEINPLCKLAKPPILNVEEDRSTPDTWRLPATVEEAA